MITPTNQQQQQKLSPKLWGGHWILINRDIFILLYYHIAPDPHQQLKVLQALHRQENDENITINSISQVTTTRTNH